MIGQRLDARHVDAGQADAARELAQERGDEPVRPGAEEHGRRRGERDRRDEDAPGIDAVAQRREQGNEPRVARIVDAARPADRGVRQPPFVAYRRHDRRKGREPGHAEDERRAESEGEPPVRHVG